MGKKELTILILCYQSKDPDEINCFEQNIQSFRTHNPQYEIFCVKSAIENYSVSYSYMDIILSEWYRIHKTSIESKRFLLINWACWCDVDINEHYKGVWDADVAGPSVLYPERDSWHWFNTNTELPVRARLYATGILPFCGILVSDRAMNEISSEICKPDFLNLESELRFATVATMLGYNPVPIPVCSRSLNWNENLPFSNMQKGLHFPRKKIMREDCLDFIDKYLNLESREMPKIFHQTWKSNHIPEHFKKAMASWKLIHPDWDFILWTDEMNRIFIKDFFPDFLLIYDSYPHNIQRVDAVRYFILYKIGGVFVDLDFECLQNIEPLIAGCDCSFGLEPAAHADQKKMDFLICNAFMAANQNNDFLKDVIDKLHLFEINRIHYFFDVLESTGPSFLTSIYSEYEHKNNINLISSEKIYPLTANETKMLLNNEGDDTIIRKIEQAYAVHYFSATWVPD
jgi:mannosyltransferase OCH1-like enzyme